MPHLQTQEVKQLKFLVETQLKITNEVLQEQIQKEKLKCDSLFWKR